MTGQFGIAHGTGGSWADTDARDYPAVPYTSGDFNPVCGINDWGNPWEMRNCMLAGLNDLNQVRTFMSVQQESLNLFCYF